VVSRTGGGRLAGKAALITGAGSEGEGVSIGRAIALLFAREGATVGVLDIDRARAEHTRQLVDSEGGSSFSIVADVTREEECERAVAEAVAAAGRLDVLVNNVGVTPVAGAMHELELEAWDRLFAVNLRAAALMTKHSLPELIAAGTASILNIASIGGLRSSGGIGYGPSKAALVQLGRDVAVAYGRQGIRVNAIAPGHIWTPMGESMGAEARERRRLVAPLGVEGTAWDVAWAAVYLTSEEARFVNGVCLPVDGGAIETMPIRAAAWL
jgi:NAD(P)-dependent dehydrogenase (short-subunit alcohol dehydrogenase family)